MVSIDKLTLAQTRQLQTNGGFPTAARAN